MRLIVFILALLAISFPAYPQQKVSPCVAAGTAPSGTGPATCSNVTATNALPVVQTPQTGTGSYFATIILTSSTQVITAATATSFIEVNNQSAVNIACRFGAAAIISGAGSINIPTLSSRKWDGTFIPTDALNCISQTSNAKATIGVK